MTSNYAGNSARCVIIDLTGGGFSILDIPAGSSSITSGAIYGPGTYSVYTGATIQSVAYQSDGQLGTITNSDITLTFNLTPNP